MTRLLLILLLTLSFSACTFKPPPMIHTKEKFALVIGNNNYQEIPLRNALTDAKQMRNFLKTKGFNVTFLPNGTTYTMRRSIKNFMNKLTATSVALVYYSGHATQEKIRRKAVKNYLIPTNNKHIRNLNDLDKYAISFKEEIVNPMRNKNQGLNIIILDACRTSMLRSLSKSMRRGLAPTRANGVFIAYATESGETASDNGLFRKSFIKYAKQNLEIADILEHVKKDVQENNNQTPFVYNDKNGDFKFDDSSQSPKDTGTPTIYKPSNNTASKYTFYGHFSSKKNRWRTRYYNIINRKSYQNKPRVGDTLQATGGVNIRSGSAYYLKGRWIHPPVIGGVHKGNTIIVKEVKEVAPGFYWIGF